MLILAFVLAALNPLGGIHMALPIAMLTLHWPAWLSVLLTIPLAFVQVLVVDICWDRLMAWPRWQTLMHKRATPRLAALFEHRRAPLLLALFGVHIGPWLITALARFSGRTRAYFALPLLISISYLAVGDALGLVLLPHLFVSH